MQQVLVSFRHMEPSEPLRDYAEEKLAKVVRKYFKGTFDARVTLSVQKFRHIVHLMVNYRGLSIKSEESSEDMYSSIDLAMDKLERQLRRYKDKLRSHKPTADGRNVTYEHAVIAAPVEDEEELFEEIDQEPPTFEGEEDFMRATEEGLEPEAEPAEEPVIVLKRERMAAPTMSLDEAIMQLNLQQAAFLVFTNRKTSSLNVIYRREDGNFGLIEPQAAQVEATNSRPQPRH